RRRHTRSDRDWSSDVCSSDLEKSALVKAVSEEYKPGDIAAIGITASPCGGCQQWLYEFKIDEITFLNAQGELATYSAADLLPDRSEERRVGKEGSGRGETGHE